MYAILFLLIFWAFLERPAVACPGQTGKIIFEDNFADDSGGWSLEAPWSEIKNDSLILHPAPPGKDDKETDTINRTFSAGDGDYCEEFVLPKAPPDNIVWAGVLFWRTDKDHQYYFSVDTNGDVSLERQAEGDWIEIYSNSKHPAVKLEPNAVNALRVVAKDGELTLFINGSQVKVIRVQKPAGELTFGLGSSVDKATDADPAVQIKSFKVTAGE